jgi:hypothetical protein
MKHRNRPPEQDGLLRPRLVDLIDIRHELVKLAKWHFIFSTGELMHDRHYWVKTQKDG